jgi:hypothetical protein
MVLLNQSRIRLDHQIQVRTFLMILGLECFFNSWNDLLDIASPRRGLAYEVT